MATYLLDFDGVFFQYGTMVPAEGAVDYVRRLKREGNEVIFLTARKTEENDPPELGVADTKKRLEGVDVPYDAVIEGISSPRIVINDEGAYTINHPRNAPWTPSIAKVPVPTGSQVTIDRVYRSLAATAWVAWKYNHSGDADDYVQTMLVAQSLLRCGGFDHADLVRRFRTDPGYKMNNVILGPGGVDRRFAGQISKLVASADPHYKASDGVSDGAAMRMSPVAAFFTYDLQQVVHTASSIAEITHASVEARLSAVLVALRQRQVFAGDQPDSMLKLHHDMKFAVELLGLKQESAFFMDRVRRAMEIAGTTSDPDELLSRLVKGVGMEHLAWSTPVSACFWSFSGEPDYSKWVRDEGEKQIWVKRPWSPIPKRLNGKTMSHATYLDDIKHLRWIGEYEGYHKTHAYHWRKSLDIDTFFSIAFSIQAARHGIEAIANEVEEACRMFGDDLRDFASQLTTGDRLRHTMPTLVAA
ncbi:MAG: hypothetical protein CBD74_07875 [Saprospirales bacterium TMED214]|nr:MAG: hypothetical protein CBD74_07875 [Saprospirales bacterium TMED214]